MIATGSNSSTSSNSSPAADAIPAGALVRLQCGSLARCYPTLDGRYKTLSRSQFGGTCVGLGWRREQLVVEPEAVS